MYDIFLSYSSKDLERVRPLFDALTKQGWSVFWDHLSIGTGENWSLKLEHAINDSRCVVVTWSQNSIQSEYVREEASFAKRRGVLLPICLDKVEPPFGFTLRQAMDFSRWNQKSDHPTFIRFASEIHVLVQTKQLLPVDAPISSSKVKLKWLLYGGIGVLSIVVVVIYMIFIHQEKKINISPDKSIVIGQDYLGQQDDELSISLIGSETTVKQIEQGRNHVIKLINQYNKKLLSLNDNNTWIFSKDRIYARDAYKICERMRPNYCLHAEFKKLASTQIQSGWLSALWVIEPTEDGHFFIKNVWKVDQYIYVDGSGFSIGKNDKKSISFQWSLTLSD
ncbi:toll/interleukin-1 receptor domain-containing protein [uncultured Thiothrix sp.]|jgi:hypothetical protein|uniref:toll/interleukin-1 receptor domain-containing protein n=1 Tax=uncultured Thiothrix sp. TaxID=223185 RepID=UPI002607A26B|nr:toll/interleukin-1 receptor domain-containing protein [uncultured Thiothrix sp.]HMT91679.1 toll/interleukin-1 receptor domain-containing protein [Thiolinea sp.]